MLFTISSQPAKVIEALKYFIQGLGYCKSVYYLILLWNILLSFIHWTTSPFFYGINMKIKEFRLNQQNNKIEKSLLLEFVANKSCLCFVCSVQCQHDPAALQNHLQHQLRVVWRPPEPLTHQRAAAGPDALSGHRGEAWAHKHGRLHGKCFPHQPEHLEGHWSSMLKCTQLAPLALYSNDASWFTWFLPSFFSFLLAISLGLYF